MNSADQITIDRSIREKVAEDADAIYRRTDRMFIVLMPLQWIGGIIAALVVSPRTWIGAAGQIHPHVLLAIFGGALLCSLPMGLALFRPGRKARAW